ncbi:E3 ubiquitin-protein ligase RING1 [Rhynchospora pubera]|uniref:E3 ubiquitin-protein ligase RING1 n=1 Tax=Rhynchospora pubera TaxID=906938 RepID=A0AAV8D6T0_9POAL|nr:E3 ubiquitin-protein ligase RING1 [Rhynchospora pubera]
MASSYRYGVDEESDRITARFMLLSALDQNPYAAVNYEDEEVFDIPDWAPSRSAPTPIFPEDSCRPRPAAMSAVAGLRSTIRSKEEPCGSEVPCAVCKEEIRIGERLTALPCTHCYHEDCIIPWLNVRNTCPLCRYELPADDDPGCEKCRD